MLAFFCALVGVLVVFSDLPGAFKLPAFLLAVYGIVKLVTKEGR